MKRQGAGGQRRAGARWQPWVIVAFGALGAALAGCSDAGHTPDVDEAATDLSTLLASGPPAGSTAASSADRRRASYVYEVQQAASEAYYFLPSGTQTIAPLVAPGWSVSLADGLARIAPEGSATDSLELRWTGWGRGRDISPVVAPRAAPELVDNRAIIHRDDGTVEWFQNGPLGLEQGFVLRASPPGSGELVVEVRVAGRDLAVAPGGQAVLLTGEPGTKRLSYRDLFAFDAAGRMLPARMSVRGPTIVIRIDDAEAAYPLLVDPLLVFETARLVGASVVDGDTYGAPVSIAADYAIVGAHDTNLHGEGNVGAAYIFERAGTGTWLEQAKLSASDGAGYDHFGLAVSVSGNYALVGAPDAVHGAVYVFERAGTGDWLEQQKLTASDSPSMAAFGSAVCVSGDRAVVGADSDNTNGSDSGSAYVFERAGTGTWLEQQKLTASDADDEDRFGGSVSITGDYVTIGANRNDDSGQDSGSAYVFERAGTGTWLEQQKLTASDGTAGQRFGSSATVAASYALIGAPSYWGATDPGAVYVFERAGTGAWVEQQKFSASDGATNHFFGGAVSASDTHAVVGASGHHSAYVFERNGTGTWLEQQRLTASDATFANDFGTSVGISGQRVIVGSWNTAALQSKAAYVFENPCLGQPDGTPCDDDSFCNGAETCSGELCLSAGDPCAGNVGDADDDCNESCDESTDDCTAADPNGSSCLDDGLFCTGEEICSNGTCASAGDPCEGPDGDDDCSEVCDEAADDCAGSDPDGSACDDGSFCNGTETCTGGVCGNSTGDPCDGTDYDDDDCSESCDEEADDCNAADPDGTSCFSGWCYGGICERPGSGGTGGTGTGTGGTGTGAGTATGGSSGSTDDDDEGGCGCRTPGGSERWPSPMALLLLGLAFLSRRGSASPSPHER